jgi:hypothetical protein
LRAGSPQPPARDALTLWKRQDIDAARMKTGPTAGQGIDLAAAPGSKLGPGPRRQGYSGEHGGERHKCCGLSEEGD